MGVMFQDSSSAMRLMGWSTIRRMRGPDGENRTLTKERRSAFSVVREHSSAPYDPCLSHSPPDLSHAESIRSGQSYTWGAGKCLRCSPGSAHEDGSCR